MKPNPFAVLGLPEWPDLDDETVRAAWRAIAAQTHPDRPDGGDLARYTQACAAFAELNTPWGRSEAYADLAGQAWAHGRPGTEDEDEDEEDPAAGPLVVFVPVEFAPQPVPPQEVLAMLTAIPGRIRHGHPLRLGIRTAILAGLTVALLVLVPAVPPLPAALVAGIFAVVYARQDMAPPPGR